MTKKEVRKAAKGCGFKRASREAKDLSKMITAFRKGVQTTNSDAGEQLQELNDFEISLKEYLQEAKNKFIVNIKKTNAEEAYTQKSSKQKKVA